jgi:Zn-dependent protease with chaperone function
MLGQETKNSTSDSTIDIAKRYSETSYKYIKLKIFHLLTSNIALLAKVFVIGILFLISILFLSISGALAIGEELNSMPLGFLSIFLIYLILTLIAYLLRKKINKSVITSFADKFFSQEEPIKPNEIVKKQSN